MFIERYRGGVLIGKLRHFSLAHVPDCQCTRAMYIVKMITSYREIPRDVNDDSCLPDSAPGTRTREITRARH